MASKSAGILPYRRAAGSLQVLLVHPGGPYWAKRDLGAWSIAKGEYEDSEDPFHGALREFEEETGHRPTGAFLPLTPIRQPSGKIVSAWAVDDAWDLAGFRSNSFTMEWPRGSGRMQSFPEVDRIAWFDLGSAVAKILDGQRGFIEELARNLGEMAPRGPRHLETTVRDK